MSVRTSLIYIFIGALLVAYAGGHIALARVVDVTVERKYSVEAVKRRFQTGEAQLVKTDKGTFGFFALPWGQSDEEMSAFLNEGQRVRLHVIDWLHGPLWEQVAGRPPRPNIIAVER